MELSLKNIKKSFGKKEILHNISFTLKPGVYGLLGPNGAGKTTLMNIVSNVSTPSNGEIFWSGKSINKMGDKYRELIGYLPQDVGLYPNFTARDFLRYVATLKDLDKSKVENRINELAKIVNLQKELDKKCGKYSGGMKRRLGVAQALLNDPKLLILDEPTAGLDPMERIRFRNMLSEISSDRIVILSTHIVSDIDRIAKNVILMNDGEIIENATTESIIRNMEGKVWEVEASSNSLNEFEKQFKISNVQQKENSLLLRIVSDTMPSPNANVVQPSLEDVYMVYFKSYSKEGEKVEFI